MFLEYKQGCTRQVLLIGKYALKLPSFFSWENFLRGLLGNIQETMLFRLWTKNGVKEHCPIILSFPGGFLNIMPRTKELNDSEFKTVDYKALCDKLGYIPEYKSNSFGWLDGRVVCFDYGS